MVLLANLFPEEPDAGNLHVRICGGPARRLSGLPDPAACHPLQRYVRSSDVLIPSSVAPLWFSAKIKKDQGAGLWYQKGCAALWNARATLRLQADSAAAWRGGPRGCATAAPSSFRPRLRASPCARCPSAPPASTGRQLAILSEGSSYCANSAKIIVSININRRYRPIFTFHSNIAILVSPSHARTAHRSAGSAHQADAGELSALSPAHPPDPAVLRNPRRPRRTAEPRQLTLDHARRPTDRGGWRPGAGCPRSPGSESHRALPSAPRPAAPAPISTPTH
jgi:hypothetical protein